MHRANDDLGDWINLGLVPGLGPGQYRSLLSAFGLPAAILRATAAQLGQVVPEAIARTILETGRQQLIEQALEWADQPGHAVITLADASYPRQLLEIANPPPLLYVIGNPALLGLPSVAIVGSRNATPQGLSNASQFGRALSNAGLAIVSGLALGIDAAAHQGGLAGPGSTIAVMGTGPEQVYPRGNRALAELIKTKGALITEFPIGTPPLPANFPRRNRLIAGLSRGVLVVEAALASGSLITARVAAEQGREVFAIPGSIHSPVSRGCHSLIKQGAKLVETAEDVLSELNLPVHAPLPDQEPQMSFNIQALLQHMGYDPCDVGTLCSRCGLTPATVSAMLLQLELEGSVGSLPGGFYQRLA